MYIYQRISHLKPRRAEESGTECVCVCVRARAHACACGFWFGVFFVGGRGGVSNRMGFPGGSVVKSLPADGGDAGEPVRSLRLENPSK